MMKALALTTRARSTTGASGRGSGIILRPAAAGGRLIRCAAATAAAAAFGTLPGTAAAAAAFAPGTVAGAHASRSPPAVSLGHYPPAFISPLIVRRDGCRAPTEMMQSPPSPPSMRLFSSRRNYDYDPDENDKDDKSILSKAADKVKSFLPTNWFKSDKEKEAAIERKRRKSEITGGIDEALKGAPLGVRMMGKMVAPLLSKAVSGIAETMQEQNRQMEGYMDDARRCIVADSAAANALGEPIVIGTPFSQSSSSANINGRVSVNVQASFEVMGSDRTGVATMVADGDGIRTLRLDVAGRSFDIDVSGRGGGGGGRGGTSSSRVSGGNRGKVSPGGKGVGQVIDAEIIDADFTEKK